MLKSIIKIEVFWRGGGETPLLSIVVPVYNVEKYLRECLDSLIHQTLKEIEIIIVNDASPDKSEEIIQEYAAKDERIVYIKHEENKCLGGARNTGIKAARGKYIAFVDSDDYVAVRLYENAVKAFESHDVDVVMMAYCSFNEQKYFKPAYRRFHGVQEMHGNQFALDFFFCLAWNKVYRLCDLKENNIFFPEHIYYEDNAFWVHYCLAVEPRAWYLSPSKGSYYYRMRPESITGNRRKNCVVLPHVFFLIYQHLQSFNKLDSLLEPFYHWISGVTHFNWHIMDDPERKVYAREYRDFIRKINLSEDQRIRMPELALICALAHENAQMLFMQVCSQKFEIQHNAWYQFGRLSPMGRIKKIVKTLIKRFLSILRKFRAILLDLS